MIEQIVMGTFQISFAVMVVALAVFVCIIVYRVWREIW